MSSFPTSSGMTLPFLSPSTPVFPSSVVQSPFHMENRVISEFFFPKMTMLVLYVKMVLAFQTWLWWSPSLLVQTRCPRVSIPLSSKPMCLVRFPTWLQLVRVMMWSSHRASSKLKVCLPGKWLKCVRF